jgi:hypothetical protein
MQPSDERENRLLREWTVDAPLPPRFKEGVWHRIRAAGSRGQDPFWRGLLHLLSATFERPKVAYSYASVLLAVGIAAGVWAAQLHANRVESDLGQRYLKSINPYQQDLARR